ncbi:MAG: S-methyl-5-thioribose kinase [Gammaproteobacteria bacterium]|nr:S-methyl-5-thioribose kinase [Gammaproteobacteria bacterium]PCH63127.1 MAG: S-methyl-5-thioribose kinase [Gammaproteobacteria bacterium]
MTYKILDKDSIPEYLDGLPKVMDVLGKGTGLDIEEIGDGNLNYVYKIRRSDSPDRSVVLKQAVPYLRMAGEGWPLSRERMTFEIRALIVYNDLVPTFVPTIYHSDEEMSVLVMQTLDDHTVVRYSMIDGVVFSDIGHDVGTFLAETLFRTSALGMESIDRRRLMDQFNLNDELCKLTENFVFTFPYMEHESNYLNPVTNKFARENLRCDTEYKLRVLKFKELFLTKADALLHADLHTGSLMANQQETYIIDTEFAYFGPFGFDVGKIIANFLMSYTSHFYHSKDDSYQNWILVEVMNIWKRFEVRFLELWAAQGESAMLVDGLLAELELREYKKRFMLNILHDSIGFCACSLARRTLGIAGVADIRGIEDMEIRSKLEIINLELSRLLLSMNDKINTIEQFESTLRSFYANINLDSLELVK